MTLRYARGKERKTDEPYPDPMHNLPHSSPNRCLCIVVLLQLVRRLLVDLAVGPPYGEALPGDHIRLGLGQQRIADVLLAASSPAVEALVTQRPDGHVTLAAHELESCRCRQCGDAVDVHLQLLAEGFERQIVYVVTEGVLDFATDGVETEDDVRSKDGSGNGDPFQRCEKLEGQKQDIDPCDLRDSDRVGEGQRCVENAIEIDETLVKGNNTGD